MPLRTSDHDILATVVVTATLKLRRRMDRGNAKRTRTYVFALEGDAVGSQGLHGLPSALAEMGGEIIAKAQTWEGGPRTPGRPVIDPLDRLKQQHVAAAKTPMQKAIEEPAR